MVGSPPSGRDALLVLMAPRSAGTPAPGAGLDSLSEEGEAQLTGDITFSAGTGITLTQVGNDIEIAVT